MGKKDGKTSRPQIKAAARTKKTETDSAACTDNAEASERFVRDLQVRGEAAKPNKAGKLPADATHAITKENEDGTVEVKRARYKLVG